jgi:pimeloyl-ACP methyl ester carboxylesterase
MVNEFELTLADGLVLHAYDTDPDGAAGDRLTVFWHHGTPNLGAPPAPLFEASQRLGIRWVSHDRPGYGGSTPRPGRSVGTAAADVAALADSLGIHSFGVMGHSGGGAHALACAALLPDRVLGAVSVSGPAPYGAEGLDWFAGMAPSGQAALRAAVAGREAKEAYEASAPDGEMGFSPADLEAFEGEWSWFGSVVGPAVVAGPAAQIDDELAYVAPWGFDPAGITAPVLLVHGGEDRIIPSSHGAWLAGRCASAELRLQPDDGHISVLRSGASALEWLRLRADR